jgi:iron complex outermembrane receptor protein
MVRDIPPLREREVSTIEAGYKGLFGRVFRLAFDVYYERRNNFVPPPAVVTPNVFFEAGQVGEAGTLANYLGKYLSAQRAQELAVSIGGIAGSTSALGFPIATVAPEGALGGSTDVLLTFRNAGSLQRWGADIAAQWLPTEQWTFTTALSWTNKDLFLSRDTDGVSDLALNAPRERASFGVQHRDRARGLTTYLRGRYVAGFPMRGGVYNGNVPSHTTVDGGLAYRIAGRERMLMNVSVQNLLGRLHREFVGAPMLGRLVSVQVQYSTR